MIETLSRRKLLGGLGLLIAAPAVIRVASLMTVKVIEDRVSVIITWQPMSDEFMDALTRALALRMKVLASNMQKLHDAHDVYCQSLRALTLLPTDPNHPISPLLG